MSTIEPALPPPDDTTVAKVTLAVLLVAWFALVGWALVDGERLSAPLKPLLARLASVTPPPGTADTAPPAPGATRPAPENASGERTRSPDERSSSSESVEPSMGPGMAETPEPSEQAGRAESVEEPDPVVTDGLPIESLLEARRTERLEMLSKLGPELQFLSGSDALGDGLSEPLEQVFEILFLYPDTAVDIALESNEQANAASDLLLSHARAQAIVDYLVSRGLERGRFTLDIGVGDGLPSGEHRVRVRVEDDSR